MQAIIGLDTSNMAHFLRNITRKVFQATNKQNFGIRSCGKLKTKNRLGAKMIFTLPYFQVILYVKVLGQYSCQIAHTSIFFSENIIKMTHSPFDKIINKICLCNHLILSCDYGALHTIRYVTICLPLRHDFSVETRPV